MVFRVAARPSVRNQAGTPAGRVLVALLVLCTGCPGGTSGAKTTAKACGSQSDCAAGEQCASGACAAASDTIDTLEELLAAAPLTMPISGTPHSFKGVSFTVPEGWTVVEFSDAARLTSPTPTEPGYTSCDMFVYAPRPAADTEQGRYQQVLDIVKGLIPGEIKAPYNNDPFNEKERGRSGAGWTFNGLLLQTGGGLVDAYVAVFDSQAVPVVMVDPDLAPTPCDVTGPSRGFEAAVLFHTLALDGWTAPKTGLLPELIGKWKMISSSAGTLTVYAANGHYLSAFGTSSTTVDNGTLYDVTSTWAGDGAYVNIGSVLGTFGKGPARSTLARIREASNSDLVSHPSGFVWQLCDTIAWQDKPGGFESCMWKGE